MAAQVLLHDPPSDISKVIDELLRVADQALIISLLPPMKASSKEMPSHVFNHDYISLFMHANCSLSNVISDGKRIYFVARQILSEHGNT